MTFGCKGAYLSLISVLGVLFVIKSCFEVLFVSSARLVSCLRGLVCPAGRLDRLVPFLIDRLVPSLMSGAALLLVPMLGAQIGSYPLAASSGTGSSPTATSIPTTVLGQVI